MRAVPPWDKPVARRRHLGYIAADQTAEAAASDARRHLVGASRRDRSGDMAMAHGFPQARGGSTRRPDNHDRPIASSLNLDARHVSAIDESHQRCAALGLSRIERPDLGLLGRSDLAVARDRNLRLHQHAAPVMELLYDQIVNTQSMVVLTDSTGTILHAIGDDDFLGRAAKVALKPGAVWSEAQKGTNAVGTALMEEQPTLVHADEHYFHANHFLTCSAAPILDPRGNILGVLDVSGDHRSYHQHTMALVKMSARMIENHWLTDDYRSVMRLHFHSRVDFIGTLMEGIIAVKPDGRIVGANRGALEQLGVSGAALRMQTLESLFGASVGVLVDRFRSPLATPLAVQHSTRTFFLHARFDWPVWTSLAEAVAAQVPSTAIARPSMSSAVPENLLGPTPPAPAAKEAPAVQDAATAQVLERLKRGLEHGLAVVLQGETGSGKQWLARSANDTLRPSRGFRMVAGHAAGADDIDAAFRRAGPDDQPHTVLLVDPGALSGTAQIHLLQRLDAIAAEGGSPALVSATRESLRSLVESGRLREDLSYRLNGLTLRVPPLRERSDRIELARTLAGAEVRDLAPDVQALIHGHRWPGNVRQMSNVLRAALVLSGGAPVIERHHLPEDFVDEAFGAAAPAAGAVLPQSLESMEVTMIRQTVDALGGNISEASKRLGISRNTIYRKLRWNVHHES
jgi:transcriptional regulator of acetoin/glycerol metabolism